MSHPTARICPHCGKAIARDRKRYCQNCGEVFVADPAAMPDRLEQTYRGVSRQDAERQAEAAWAEARARGYQLERQTWSEDRGVHVLTVEYRAASPPGAPSGSPGAPSLMSLFVPPKPKAETPPNAPAAPGESGAHKLLNGLISLWTFGYAAVILLPIMNSDGQGEIGALVGFGAAVALFVPWAVVLLILLVLRSTTRSR